MSKVTNKVDYILSGNTLSLFSGGKKVVLTGNEVAATAKLLADKKYDEVYKKHFEVPVALQGKLGNREVEVKDGMVFIDGKAVSGLLNTRLVEYLKIGLPTGPLVKFFRRIQSNPSFRAVERLFECLDHNKHPLAEDGRFLAWKRVRSDFKDIYSGKFDNSVGSKPSVPRNQVDENMDNTCSKGLHVASFDYAAHSYGSGQGVLVEVLVDPADVVAIPRDYNSQKMRVTTYEVIKVCETQRQDQLVTVRGETADTSRYNNEDVDLFDEDEDDEYDTGYSYGEPDDDDDWDDDDDDFLDEDEDDEDDGCGDPNCWCRR